MDARDAQIAMLLEQNRELRRLLAPEFDLPPSLRLPRRQKRALAAIMARSPLPVSFERVHAAMYFDLDDAPDRNAVHSHVCKLRRALKPLGVRVLAERHCGYHIPSEDAARLLAMMQPAPPTA